MSIEHDVASADGGPVFFSGPQELLALKATSLPDGTSFVFRTMEASLHPEMQGPWRVSNGRFIANVTQGIRDADWTISMKPEEFVRIMEIAINERARAFNDIALVESRLRPQAGMSFGIRYNILPQDDVFLLAYLHAYNVCKQIDETTLRAATLRVLHAQDRHASNQSTDIERLMFIHAEVFRNAADWLYRQACGSGLSDEVRRFVADAEITNRAFATELFVKCLLRIETNKRPPNWHNLKSLFGKLAKPVRDEIVRYFYQQRATSHHHIRAMADHGRRQKDEFGTSLARGKLAFQNYRYVYEIRKREDGIPGGAILLAIRHAIVVRKPSWTVLSSTQPAEFDPHVGFGKP